MTMKGKPKGAVANVKKQPTKQPYRKVSARPEVMAPTNGQRPFVPNRPFAK